MERAGPPLFNELASSRRHSGFIGLHSIGGGTGRCFNSDDVWIGIDLAQRVMCSIQANPSAWPRLADCPTCRPSSLPLSSIPLRTLAGSLTLRISDGRYPVALTVSGASPCSVLASSLVLHSKCYRRDRPFVASLSPAHAWCGYACRVQSRGSDRITRQLGKTE